MKTLILLLLSLQCAAQTPTLTIGPGAGKEPIVLFSGGQDFSVVDITVGYGATNGSILTIDISEGGEVESVEYSMWVNGVFSSGAIATKKEIRLINFDDPNKCGAKIEAFYRVKRKPIKRA